ncbi:molybdopterin biosynthesis protein MoeB [Sporosarcina pasteurii]|uniref:Molybdopterin biosynthesis protein MoeB n=2 Tax=Sporosarcina pasteurii TaxID=1474 RepID=A0A380CCS7_SPOPA|nr:molybdopterin biosynthesis protein MoeB [Sporosarcina pasteurii]
MLGDKEENVMAKQITPAEVERQLQDCKDLSIIDVRESAELLSGKIPGARNISFTQLALRKDELDKETNYVVVCQSGNRSKAACGILEALGFNAVNMTGGMNDWRGELE